MRVGALLARVLSGARDGVDGSVEFLKRESTTIRILSLAVAI